MLVDLYTPANLMKGLCGGLLAVFRKDCQKRNVQPTRRQAARFLSRSHLRYCTAQTPIALTVESFPCQKEAS